MVEVVPWAFTEGLLTYMTILAASIGVCIVAMKL